MSSRSGSAFTYLSMYVADTFFWFLGTCWFPGRSSPIFRTFLFFCPFTSSWVLPVFTVVFHIFPLFIVQNSDGFHHMLDCSMHVILVFNKFLQFYNFGSKHPVSAYWGDLIIVDVEDPALDYWNLLCVWLMLSILGNSLYY